MTARLSALRLLPGLAFWALAFVSVTATAVAAGAVTGAPWLAPLASAGAIAAMTVAVVARSHAREWDAFSPLGLICFFYLASFAAGGIYYYIVPWPFPSSPYERADITPAVALGALSLFMLILGYTANPLRALLRVLPRFPSDVSTARSTRLVVILLAAGWLARVYDFQAGHYFYYAASDTVEASTASSTLVSIVTKLPLLATAYVGAKYYFARREEIAYRTLQWQYFALVGVELAYGVPRGMRIGIIEILVMMIVVRYYALRRRPPLLALAVGALVSVVVIFPLFINYRSAQSGTGYQQNLGQNIGLAAEQLVKQSPTEAWSTGFRTTFERFGGVTSVAAIIHYGPESIGRKPGETLSWLGTALVPRAFLPDKADPTGFSNEFGITLGIVPPGSRSYITTTHTGEMYFNYGVPGVVFGLFLVGAFYRLLAEYLRRRKDDAAAIAVYGVIAMTLINSQEAIVAASLPGIVKTLAIYAAALFVASRLANVRAPHPTAVSPAVRSA